MEDIYREYGFLMIQMEIIQNRINELKKQISEELNKKAQEQQKPAAE
jgi:hypothetical protein